MPFQIRRADEADEIKTVNILIYGEPGSGKTSLANTMKNPITLDFDKGSHRSDYRKDRIRITDWEKDIVANLRTIETDFKEYKTIIIDTVETALESLGAYIIKKDSKYATPKYKLQYYGQLKDEFAKIIAILNSLGKDVVQIAHVKEKDEGDFRIKRPQITGGTYDKILQITDFVGYMSIISGKRTIEFDPTESHVGKNSAKFPLLEIDDFNKNAKYGEELVEKMKASLTKISEAQAKAISELQIYKEIVSNLTTAEELNEYIPALQTLDKALQLSVWNFMQKHAKKIECEYHKVDKVFYPKPTE